MTFCYLGALLPSVLSASWLYNVHAHGKQVSFGVFFFSQMESESESVCRLTCQGACGAQ